MYNKVELCGVNTAELPILSEQEKRDLLTRARAGDKAARQSMIEGNLRLVLSVVQRFSQRGENMDGLFQVGCIGLIKADVYKRQGRLFVRGMLSPRSSFAVSVLALSGASRQLSQRESL